MSIISPAYLVDCSDCLPVDGEVVGVDHATGRLLLWDAATETTYLGEPAEVAP